MNKLFIDTATKTLIVSLYKELKVVDARIELANRDHSSRLMPAIQRILQDNNLDLKDLDAIYCSKGPGSYTGVRIGVTVAKTLAWTLNKELYSISSLKVIATLTRLDHGKFILPVIDARRGNVFSALYQFNGSELVTIIEDGLYNFKELLNRVEEEVGNKVTVVGSDLELHKTLLYNYGFQINLNLDFDHIPKQVITLNNFEHVNQIHEFVPSYKRLTEAERNLKK